MTIKVSAPATANGSASENPDDGVGGFSLATIAQTTSQPDAALTLAATGLYVFPVDHPELPVCAGVGKNHDPFSPDHQRGKHPCIAWGEKATINPQAIYAHWSGGPRNIGIHCGKSNLVVADEDLLGELKRYADEHGVKIPPTLVVRTAKGRHYYFRAREDHPLGNKEGAFADYSINIRAGNGYVVAPGSIHATGVMYIVEVDLPPAPLPDWFIDAIQTKPQWETVNGNGQGYQLPEIIKDHHRHTELTKYASSLRARSIPRSEAETLFRDAWQRCEQPPMARFPVTWEEALEKLDDVYERYPDGKSAEYQREREDKPFDLMVIDEVRKIQVRERAREIVNAAKQPPAEPFDAGTLAEILARPKPPAARVDELIPWEAGTLVTAQRKTGKTTLILNLARSLLTGQNFLGRFGVRPIDGEVAILNYEVSADQLARWADESHIDQEQLFLVNLRGRRNPLANEDDRAKLAALLRRRGTESLFVDPFGRAYTGQNQNDNGEVGAWLATLDHFARSDVGARDLILTAHAGWNQERTRGPSALEDWGDSIITMTRSDEEDGGERFIRALGRDVELDEDRLDYDSANRTLTLAGTGSRKAAKAKRKTEKLPPEILKLVKAKPGINGSGVERELRDNGVVFQRGEHRSALKALVDSGELVWEPGPHNAKCYRIKAENTPDSPDSPDSPQIAHGLGQLGSPVRPIGDGLPTTNTGPPNEDTKVGLTGSDSLDLFSAETPKTPPKRGICAG